MNLHIPQSLEARVEAYVQACVSRHIMTPQFNGPIMGLFQDAPLAAYLLTRTQLRNKVATGRDRTESSREERGEGVAKLKRKLVSSLVVAACIPQERVNDWCKRAHDTRKDGCMSMNAVTGRARMNKRICGACVFSVLFPAGMRWSRTTGTDEQRPKVAIENGVLTSESGPLCASALNKGSASILAHIVTYYGEERGELFLTEATRLTDTYMPSRGFTVGWADCAIEDTRPLNGAMQSVELECRSILQSTEPGPQRELLMNSTLNAVLGSVSSGIAKTMRGGEDNGFVVMKRSGAKGTDVNIVQIAAFVGQQNIEGARPEKGLSGGRRCQTAFAPGDDSPAARGFIGKGYFEGITPEDEWAHACSARVGVIDVTMKTADIGYVGKRTGKKSEDLTAMSDGTVRDAMNNVVVFCYGDDAMDARKLTTARGVKRPFFADLQTLADIASRDSTAPRRNLTESEISAFLKYVHAGRLCDQQAQPIRLASANLKNECARALTTVLVAGDRLGAFCKRLSLQLESGKLQEGTAVGLIASCSVSEVASQMTLHTHRAIGRSDVDVTAGFPKFNQYINASKSPTKSSCTFRLSHEVEEALRAVDRPRGKVDDHQPHSEADQNLPQNEADQEPRSVALAVDVVNSLVHLTVKELVTKSELLYTDEKTCPLPFLRYEKWSPMWWEDEYRSLTKESLRVSGGVARNEQRRTHGPWVLRLHLDVMKLYARRVHLSTVVERIAEQCGSDVLITRSPMSAGRAVASTISDRATVSAEQDSDGPVIELSLLMEEDGRCSPYLRTRDAVTKIVNETVVQGVPGITKTSLELNTQGSSLRSGCAKGASFVVKTEGSDLRTLMNCSFVDWRTAVSDDVWDVLNTLGIEAARHELMVNIRKLISFGGSYVNDRHYQLLADRITFSGTLKGANHGGLEECPILSRAMFERPVQVLTDSCAFGGVDTTDSVASAVMFGKPAKLGSNVVVIRSADMDPVV